MHPQCRYIDFKFPQLPQIGCAFSTRWLSKPDSGFKNQDESQKALARGLQMLQGSLGFQDWKWVHQVHGRTMAVLEQSRDGRTLSADALATSQPKLALVICTADCQPILMSDRSGGAVAALHVGWRANREETIQKWVDTFCQHFKLKARDLVAVRGPSLSPPRSEFINFSREWGTEFLPYFSPEEQTVNLWQLTRDQFVQAGLPAANIFSLDLCTYSLPELFFSHRRSRDLGRQTGLIWMKGDSL